MTETENNLQLGPLKARECSAASQGVLT